MEEQELNSKDATRNDKQKNKERAEKISFLARTYVQNYSNCVDKILIVNDKVLTEMYKDIPITYKVAREIFEQKIPNDIAQYIDDVIKM